MKRALLLLAACSKPPAPSGCEVELSGNFAESSTSPKSCPRLAGGAGATQGHLLLRFGVPSRTLGASFTIEIDLGAAPTPGIYNAGTTTLWNASGVKTVPPGGACMILAGNNATPTGHFLLDLASVTPAHGTLAVTMFVLPRTSDAGVPTDCGRGTTEDLRLAF